jgi:membrane-associated phospholipid phosphatase
MDVLQKIDVWFFKLINHDMHNGYLDFLVPLWRSMYFWMPVYVFVVSYFLLNLGKKGRIWLLAIVVCIGISDTISSKMIKPLVHRARPCQNEQVRAQAKLLVTCGSGFSFPSSHATNHFAMAAFALLTLGSFFEKKRWWAYGLFGWASSIALGQVYVGVHYPIDVVSGAILGCGIGFGVSKCFEFCIQRGSI